jgi:protein-S-isoprenylcysteine O-methyltransferase Ste14
MNNIPGKVLYGVLFCVVLPALLVVWAQALEARLPALPAVTGWVGGWPLVALGSGLLAWGMWDLWFRGGGLPMTPFPPPRLVAEGIYRWLPHPIYGGFALLMLGVFVVADLSAGVWIVSPVIWLGTLALVVGHERIDLQRRFGSQRAFLRLGLAPDSTEPPRWWHRAAPYLLVFGPWLAVQHGMARLLECRLAISTYLPIENTWRLPSALLVVYGAGFCWVALAPLAAVTQAELRRFVRDSWAAAALLAWCHLALPLTAPSRLSEHASGFGGLLAMLSGAESGWGAFPSPQACWVLLAARLWRRRMPQAAAFGLAGALAAGGVAAGATSLLGALAGAGVFALTNRLDECWRGLLRATERLANSWRDWRLGPVRIINHGAYVGLAAAAGVWLVGFLLGASHGGAILVVAVCSLLGAGIWAQLLESSSGLSRPFGYYGGIFGGWLGVLAVQLWRGDGWLLMGAFAVASPLVQAIGRLRCLVQGCCHGRPCAGHLGIRYHQPLSRVCKLAGWGGRPVYPTPLYSMLGNAVILGLLLRLWLGGAELGFITGATLILTACARFMEEGYRGEPQTARSGGLAIYQWLALAFVIGGAVCTVVPTSIAPTGGFGGGPQALFVAVPFGLLVWFAMGVDFPESNRRFSRLA